MLFVALKRCNIRMAGVFQRSSELIAVSQRGSGTESLNCFEDSGFTEFHLFCRGPVAAGPLTGALSVGRKPLNVCVHDVHNDESNRYLFAYRVNRRLLQEA